MYYKYVLYTEQLTAQMRTRLRIVKYRKIQSKKNNVYFVDFASKEDVQYAQKACKRMQNVTIKPFNQTKPSTSVTIPSQETTSSSMTTVVEKTITAAIETTIPQVKVKLLSRCLPPNSLETRQLLESIDACLNAMSIVKHAFDEICQLHQAKKYSSHHELLFNRFYTEHSTALYMKMALAHQLKAMFSTNLRLEWSMIASQVNMFERHVYHEQTFMKNIQSKSKDLFKRIHFQSSIAMSAKVAYELIKSIQT